MGTSYQPGAGDTPLVHRFIRIFGHRPSSQELERYQRTQAALADHRPMRLRHRAARMITRL